MRRPAREALAEAWRRLKAGETADDRAVLWGVIVTAVIVVVTLAARYLG